MPHLPSSSLLAYIHPEALAVALRTEDGSPCCEIDIEQLKILVACELVVGKVRGKKLRAIHLTVSPDVAFRELGETRQRVKDCLHSDASRNTRAVLLSTGRRIAHHAGRCSSYASLRPVVNSECM